MRKPHTYCSLCVHILHVYVCVTNVNFGRFSNVCLGMGTHEADVSALTARVLCVVTRAAAQD